MSLSPDGGLGSGAQGAKYEEKGKDKKVSPPIVGHARVGNTYAPSLSRRNREQSAPGIPGNPRSTWLDGMQGDGSGEPYQGAADGSDFESGEQGQSCDRGQTSQAEDTYNVAKKAQDEGVYGYKTHGRDVKQGSASKPNANQAANATKIASGKEAPSPVICAGCIAAEAADKAGADGKYAPTEDGGPTSDKDIVRGQRNNNPGNITDIGQNHPGKIGNDGRFGTYSSPEAGIGGFFRDIGAKVGRGTNTIAKILPIYAPASENNTQAYINNASSISGVGRNTPLNLSNKAQMTSVARGFFQVENGSMPYSQSQLDAGYESAFNNGPLPAGGGYEQQDQSTGKYSGYIQKQQAAGRGMASGGHMGSNAETAVFASNGLTAADAAVWGKIMAANHGGKDIQWLIDNGYPEMETIVKKMGALASVFKTPIELATLWKNQFFSPYPSLGSAGHKMLQGGGGGGQDIQSLIDGAKSKLEDLLGGLGDKGPGDIAIFESDTFKNEVLQAPIDKIANTDLIEWADNIDEDNFEDETPEDSSGVA